MDRRGMDPGAWRAHGSYDTRIRYVRDGGGFGAAVVRTFQAAVGAVGTVVGAVRGFAMTWTSRAAYGISMLLGRTNIDYASEVGDPTRNSIVMAVVGWIARNFPEAPVRIAQLMPDGTRQYVAPSHLGPGAMLELLERPNRYFSGVLMWIAAIVDLYCTGNAYLLKVRNGSGRVVELWWIPKRLMRPWWPENDDTVFIAAYLYTPNGIPYLVHPDDVIHLRDGIDPANTRLGLSKLASLFREIFTDDEAANFSATLLTNLGVPGVIISPANTNTGTIKSDPDSVKKAFMEKFGGDKRGEPLVLSAPTDVKVLSFSPEQMNLRDLRKIPEERISAVLGVSAIVAGLGAGLDRSTFTNFGEARQAATEESLIPLWRLVAAELEVQLLDDYVGDLSGWDIDFDLRNVRALAESIDAIWKRTESAATKGLLTRAAFKHAIGEPVAADGTDDVYVLPNNYTAMPVGGSFPPTGVTPPPGGRPRAPRVSESVPLEAVLPEGNGHQTGVAV